MLPFRPQHEAAFLASEPTWRHRIGKGWHGTKFLGRGSFGVTGLWEYQGNDPNPPALRHVVVKQSQLEVYMPGGGHRSALDEGNIGLTLSFIKAKHLVRQYGGNRLGDSFAEMGRVIRIFMEYCPGGDLSQFVPMGLAAMRKKPEPLSEMDCWTIFKCLALGVLAMDKRTEEPLDALEWNDDEELMHCDLKCDNVFLGYRDKDHARIPILSIGDFGESIMVPSQELQGDEDGGAFLDRGAPAFKPPEETINWPFGPWQETGIGVQNPRKGTCSNIWQVGAIMNCLILQVNHDFNPNRCDDPRDPRTSRSSLAERGTPLASNLNHSIQLDRGEEAERYSKTLRMLIQECLFREAPLRPSSIQLVDAASQGLNSTMRGILALTKRTGNSGLQALPANIQAVAVRMPGYLDPEPPTSFLVDHRAWDEALIPTSILGGETIGGLVTGLARPVPALAGRAATLVASSAASTATTLLKGGFRFLSTKIIGPESGPPADGRARSRSIGHVAKANRVSKRRSAAPPRVNLQTDEPGFVIINRERES
ncbi:hypothetical protein LZ554_003971 [Drepanopeziza brunnea f. sp. 'monogermtubi']|nr:hypothetical protein LZ554_003971 [Drepanopeziza brunnea f. sp. 'monogermtubi']